MNITKIPPPTDEEILSFERVPPLAAAKYIGMTYTMLTYKMQQDIGRDVKEIPFGTAEMGKSRWTYSIDPQRLYDYKHNVGRDAVIQKILKQQAEILKMLTEILTNDRAKT